MQILLLFYALIFVFLVCSLTSKKGDTVLLQQALVLFNQFGIYVTPFLEWVLNEMQGRTSCQRAKRKIYQVSNSF